MIGILEQKKIITNTIPLGNIISEWKFEDNVLDTVGSNNGTATSITYDVSGVGKSAVFDGSSSKIEVADSSNLSFGNGVTDSPFSISFLVNFDTVNNTNRILLEKLDGLIKEYLIFLTTSNTIRFNLADDSAAANLIKSTTTTFSTATWYHITCAYDGSGLASGVKIYVNGTLETMTDTSIGSYTAMENTTARLFIGSRGLDTLRLDGKMDVVRVWDKELTQSEITDISTAELAGTDINP